MSQLTMYHCRFCNELIPIGRIDRVYCSKACKQRAYRWRNKVDRYAREIRRNLSAISEYLDYDDTKSEALRQLAIIREECVNEARKHGLIIKAVK
jgi:Fe-S-cluster-containing dehydrogenase component